MSAGGADWLRELARQLALDGALVQALDAELAAAFRDRTGEDLAGYRLVPPLRDLPPRLARFDPPARQGDRLVVEGELMHRGWLFPVALSWRAEAPFSPRWDELPVDDVRYAAAERRALPVPPDLPFAVEIDDPVWPHVRVVVALSEPLTAEDRHALGERLRQLVDTWPGPGAIHRFAMAPPSDPRTVVINADFGSTGAESLGALLRALAAVGLPVAGVRLD